MSIEHELPRPLFFLIAGDQRPHLGSDCRKTWLRPQDLRWESRDGEMDFDNDSRHEENWKWSEGCWKELRQKEGTIVRANNAPEEAPAHDHPKTISVQKQGIAPEEGTE
jgi:hypothetical protein